MAHVADRLGTGVCLGSRVGVGSVVLGVLVVDGVSA